MKLIRISSFFLLVLAALLVMSPTRARADVSFDFFYDNLSPYGSWVEVEGYGPCWQPSNVDVNWSPYSDGYWAYTDAGWTWVSYEDFGGIVYHYGRWVRVDGEGWCWVPDYQWGPAWVSWRTSNDYVGWAPLPPEARWRHEVGISVWVDSAYDIGPGYYSFCHVRDFGAPVLRPVLIDPVQNVTIIRTTVNVTNITYNSGFAGGGVVFNGGPRYEVINAAVSHPVPTLKLVTNADAAAWHNHKGGKGGNVFASQTLGNQLIVAAPRVLPPADPGAFKGKAKVIYTADRVSKGWTVVKGQDAQKELRQEIHRQTKGLTPESAPAHAVVATDLKSVPPVGDPHAKSSSNGPGEPHEKSGKDRHPESIVVAPPTVPPAAPPTKSFTSEPSGKPGSQLPPPSKGVVTVPNPEKEQGGFRGADEGRNTKDKKGDRESKDKQISAQQDDARRREFEAQQQQKQLQQQEKQTQQQEKQTQQPQQLQQQPPPLQQRSADGGRGKDSEKQKDHKSEKVESPRANQFPPPVQHAVPPPGSQPPASSPQSGRHSKDGKDKEKDKEKNNGN